MMERQTPKSFINDFTSGGIMRPLLAFSIPLLLSNLLQILYNMVDMVVVGKVVGEAGLSGLSVGGDVLSFLTFLSMGFSNAGQVIISQYIGAGWRERLSRLIGTMLTFLMLCAAILSVACLLLRNQILGWMNTPPEAWGQATAYSVTCISGLLFIYGYNAVSAILRGMGDSKRPFLFVALAAVLNLLLDLLFVAVFRWEAFGAALATVIGQGTSFLCSLIYLYRKRERFGFDFSPHSFRIHMVELVTLVKLGVPMAIRSAFIIFSKLFVNAWVNGYGVTVSAVSGIGGKLDSICALVAESITTAGSSMVGQNIGAGTYDRVPRILSRTFLLSCVYFLPLIAAVFFFPRAVFSMFTNEPGVLEVCMEYVPAALILLLGCMARAPMNGFTYGCGNYKFNFCLAIMDGIAARIGLSLLLGTSLGLGYFGFWMGSAAAGFMPFLLGGVYFLSGRWRKSNSLLTSE